MSKKRRRWSRLKDKHPIDDSVVQRYSEDELADMPLLDPEYKPGRPLSRRDILIWRAEHFDFYND